APPVSAGYTTPSMVLSNQVMVLGNPVQPWARELSKNKGLSGMTPPTLRR
ncbi:MAG: hypothetical protein ACI8PT_003118, partial [Gammaproteobacteria bacterium]